MSTNNSIFPSASTSQILVKQQQYEIHKYLKQVNVKLPSPLPQKSLQENGISISDHNDNNPWSKQSHHRHSSHFTLSKDRLSAQNTRNLSISKKPSLTDQIADGVIGNKMEIKDTNAKDEKFKELQQMKEMQKNMKHQHLESKHSQQRSIVKVDKDQHRKSVVKLHQQSIDEYGLLPLADKQSKASREGQNDKTTTNFQKIISDKKKIQSQTELLGDRAKGMLNLDQLALLMPKIKGAYGVRKVSVNDLAKDEYGFPLKINEDYLSLQNFSSMSEKERYLKNAKLLNDIMIEYQRNHNHFEVSQQFLQKIFTQNDFKKLSIAEIHSVKDFIESKQIDCKKDIVSGVKEVLSKANGVIAEGDHCNSKDQLQKKLVFKLPVAPITSKNVSYKQWSSNMTPRTIKALMEGALPKDGNKGSVPKRHQKKKVIIHHSIQENDKSLMLAKYIEKQTICKTFSQSAFETSCDNNNNPSQSLDQAGSQIGKSSMNNRYSKLMGGMPTKKVTTTIKLKPIQPPSDLKVVPDLSPVIRSLASLGQLQQSHQEKIGFSAAVATHKRHSLSQVESDQQKKYDLEKLTQIIEKGQYQQLFENVYESAAKVKQDVMKKNNLLLEHIIMEREELTKKKKRRSKKKKNNKKWWIGKNEASVQLFELPYFQDQF